ncbi:Holliday junction resolvase RuvX [Thiomonas sp.]|jgi:putative Holliday junction resolvase|uniref:Holliday junction resolvase RuvX n=1 Tax=Thiomonas sp. TaxID=2047785 RepID=UPI00262AE5C1|nr:Holliday junction resolvase RuvX [Thiomonas sp.]
MPEPGGAPGDPAVLMGFDFGTHRIGVAVGNTVTASASALCSVAAERRQQRFESIARLLAQWKPSRLVVGLPLSRDEGAEQDRSAQARRFANQLHGRFGLPVAMVDERYTSRAAEDEGADDVDAESARLILEQYLRDPAASRAP